MGAGAERRRRRRRRRHGRGGRRAARRDRGVFRRVGERRRADPPRRRAQARPEARGGAHGRTRAPRQRAPGRRRRREGELLGAALRARRRRAAEARGRRDLRVAAIEGREQRPLLLDDGARGPRDLWGLRVRAERRSRRRPHRRRGVDGRRLSSRAAPHRRQAPRAFYVFSPRGLRGRAAHGGLPQVPRRLSQERVAARRLRARGDGRPAQALGRGRPAQARRGRLQRRDQHPRAPGPRGLRAALGGRARGRAGQESEIPNFKGSYLGRFPLVLADFWTSDHLSERSRSTDAFLERARAEHSR